MPEPYRYIDCEPENKYSKMINNQKIIVLPKFELESGITLYEVPVAFKSWGKLNKEANNCIVICHSLTGTANAAEWWRDLFGEGKAFDATKYFIVCLNSLGSPYGTASPMTLDPLTSKIYGPEFPLTTIRDDAYLHKTVLDILGVKQIALVLGGSMGGMLTLEYLCCFGSPYIRSFVAFATSARHSAWCIAWGEAQRQSIYSDPKFHGGYYNLEDGPDDGLAAARMNALLTYRSRDSFETRFARDDPKKIKNIDKSKLNLNGDEESDSLVGEKDIEAKLREKNFKIHNEGNKKLPVPSPSLSNKINGFEQYKNNGDKFKTHQSYFTAQSYLRYQGMKFIGRFDPNCYVSITKKLDTHDIARDRFEIDDEGNKIPITIQKELNKISQPGMVFGVTTDVLFPLHEQQLIAENIPNAGLEIIESNDGHDAFLLEFNIINDKIVEFQKKYLLDIYNAVPVDMNEDELFEKANPLFTED